MLHTLCRENPAGFPARFLPTFLPTDSVDKAVEKQPANKAFPDNGKPWAADKARCAFAEHTARGCLRLSRRLSLKKTYFIRFHSGDQFIFGKEPSSNFRKRRGAL
jgi:hypothetical protein